MKAINAILIAMLSVCCTKTDTNLQVAAYHGEDRDSLLVNFLLSQFNTFHYDRSSLEKQLKDLRSGVPNTDYIRSNSAGFRNFHLQSFRFDSQTHPPFALEVTDDSNNLVYIFTFTDEVYYNTNGLSARGRLESLVLDSKASNDFQRQKVNLETNLNLLIMKLGLERDPGAMHEVIDMIFRKLLEMKTYEDSELVTIIEQLGGDRNAAESVLNEYKNFIDSQATKIFRFKSLEGNFGYWRIWVDEVDGVYKVRTRFFSDTLFTSSYM